MSLKLTSVTIAAPPLPDTHALGAHPAPEKRPRGRPFVGECAVRDELAFGDKIRLYRYTQLLVNEQLAFLRHPAAADAGSTL